MLTSMTRPWKNGEPARSPCGGRCPTRCWRKWGRRIPRRPRRGHGSELHDVLHTLVAVRSSCQVPVVSYQRDRRQDSLQPSAVSSQEEQLLGGGALLGASNDPLEARSPRLVADWLGLFDRLQAENRAVVVEASGEQYWVAAERLGLFPRQT